MSTNIFIDTSTYLSFYAVSNDDLAQLEKLVDLIADGRVKILITSQVEREWARNRDNKLAEAINNINKLSFKSPSIPRFMWEYAEVAELRKALSAAEKARTAALVRAKLEAETATTNADRLIQRIFVAAGIEPDDEAIFDAAERRMLMGDPPGKTGSLGDRLNWEHLLASKITNGDLHIISKDGDYFSPLGAKTPKFSLYREWVNNKNGKLFVHLEIKQFLSSKFPQFQFKQENNVKEQIDEFKRANRARSSKIGERAAAIKEMYLNNLENATSPEKLEIAVKEIEKLSPELGEANMLRICKFAIKTDLVREYDGDEPVTQFFERIVSKVYHLLDRKDIEALEIVFDIELHPEEFQTENDPLFPDYGQMDLDLLDDSINNLENYEDSSDEVYH